MGTWFGGSQDLYFWGWADGGRRVGANYPQKLDAQIDSHLTISRSIGWWYPFHDFCIITDRPSILKFDEDQRLHCENGPAVLYRDDYSMYAWHGLAIPEDWIKNKAALTPESALTWHNVEQRRAACEILGWATILEKLDSTLVDQDDDPLVGELIEVNLPDIGREKFLKVRCGTGRTFALPVPPEMMTALQANAWTYDIPEEVIRSLEVRT